MATHAEPAPVVLTNAELTTIVQPIHAFHARSTFLQRITWLLTGRT